MPFRTACRVVLLAVVCVRFAAHAEITQDADKPLVLKPDVLHAYLKAVEAAARGEPVIAVEYPMPNMGRDDTLPPLPDGTPLRERLAPVAEAYSMEDVALAPLRMRGITVMALAQQDTLNLDLWKVTPMDVTSPRVALEMFLMSLSREQVAGINTDAGLPSSRFSREQLAFISRALAPPLRLVEKKMQTKVFPNGAKRDLPVDEQRGEIAAPVDLSRVAIRARLRMDAPTIELNGKTFGGFGWNRPPLGLEVQGEPAKLTAVAGGGSVPALKSVPNALKPSDLDGKAYTTPIGVDGRLALKDVLDRVAQRTGLRLRPAYGYKDLTVFIGSPDMTCGDVLDGLALALTATWRRLGPEYILCWDRAGLRALQLSAMEVTAASVEHVSAQRDRNYRNPLWSLFANTTPFAEDSLILPSEQQRARMFEPGREVSADRRLHYADMTPDQQEVVRSLYKGIGVHAQADGGLYFIKEEDLVNAYLEPKTAVELSLFLPGYGWTRIPFMPPGDIDGEMLERYRLETAEASARDAASEGEGRITLPKDTRNRAVMAPALGPSRMAEVIRSMQRHALNVLFYPVLSEGYATFQTKAFPLNPALREKDPWPALEQAARAANIRLVGYVDLLTWQPVSARVHWVAKHADWLDVDMLGRTPAKWWEENPDGQLAGWEAGTVVSNYVRAADPQVESRLTELVRDFAATKRAAGIAFADWDASPGPDFGTHTRPPLGYTTADRRAVVQRTGRDPVDDFTLRGFTSPLLSATGAIYSPPADEDVPPPAGEALAARLLKLAKDQRADWTTYLLNDDFRPQPPRTSGEAPQADVEARLVQYLDNPIPPHATLRAWPETLYGSAQMPSRLRFERPMNRLSRASEAAAKASPAPEMVLFDFRGAPSELTPFFLSFGVEG